jgi:hypothetical protein
MIKNSRPLEHPTNRQKKINWNAHLPTEDTVAAMKLIASESTPPEIHSPFNDPKNKCTNPKWNVDIRSCILADKDHCSNKLRYNARQLDL